MGSQHDLCTILASLTVYPHKSPTSTGRPTRIRNRLKPRMSQTATASLTTTQVRPPYFRRCFLPFPIWTTHPRLQIRSSEWRIPPSMPWNSLANVPGAYTPEFTGLCYQRPSTGFRTIWWQKNSKLLSLNCHNFFVWKSCALRFSEIFV